jgi:Aspartyl protease
MKVGNKFLSLSITVLESKDMEFLFGLDMLRRYRCSIDLFKNVLRFPDIDLELPFLSEHELPMHARNLELPEVDAPTTSGTATGAPRQAFVCHDPSVLSCACRWGTRRSGLFWALSMLGTVGCLFWARSMLEAIGCLC